MDQPSHSQNYSCTWSVYAERHYAKTFAKQYKNHWLTTKDDITELCKRIDNILLYSRADLICNDGTGKIIKLDFAVAGTRVSPKASGNRAILFVDEKIRHVEISGLLQKSNRPAERNRQVEGCNSAGSLRDSQALLVLIRASFALDYLRSPSLA
jgi:hypothetical protein